MADIIIKMKIKVMVLVLLTLSCLGLTFWAYRSSLYDAHNVNYELYNYDQLACAGVNIDLINSPGSIADCNPETFPPNDFIYLTASVTATALMITIDVLTLCKYRKNKVKGAKAPAQS